MVNQYSEDVKIGCIKSVKEGAAVKDVAKAYGISGDGRVIYSWIAAANKKGKKAKRAKKAKLVKPAFRATFKEFRAVDADPDITLCLANGIKLGVKLSQLKDVLEMLK